jgi:ADP-dependent NAD(P)H-hydrate dehydratase / NAD(P)H-hydrate epimerase
MLPVLTSSQMREADRRTIEEIGLPGAVLMENAGVAVARAIHERAPQARRITVLCGRGNNGGDGFVIARQLIALKPVTILLGTRKDLSGDARLHLGVLERSGGVVAEVTDAASWQAVRPRLAEADVVVDAMLGTGLRQAPTGMIQTVIDDLRLLRDDRRFVVVAVDIPSGLSADSGEVAWPTVEADLTVSFATAKYGHVLPPACDHVGDLKVVDIGIPASVLAEAGAQLFLLEATDAAAGFAFRQPADHKGSFGHVLVLGGAAGKTGAAILAGTGALRSGAGLVTVATSREAAATVAQGRPELMTEILPTAADGRWAPGAVQRAIALAATRDALVLGPGLGNDPATRDLVREVLKAVTLPVVVDADGLNALAGSSASRTAPAHDLLRRSAPTVVTPHPGEMARLVAAPTAEVQRRRLETARAFAIETGAVVVLKGHRTLVAHPDGRTAVNPTGNPGMATGGTGDVLAGVVGALLARELPPWIAATAAVYVHGAAGDLAAAEWGQESLLAGDVADQLPDAIRAVTATRKSAGGGHH